MTKRGFTPAPKGGTNGKGTVGCCADPAMAVACGQGVDGASLSANWTVGVNGGANRRSWNGGGSGLHGWELTSDPSADLSRTVQPGDGNLEGDPLNYVRASQTLRWCCDRSWAATMRGGLAQTLDGAPHPGPSVAYAQTGEAWFVSSPGDRHPVYEGLASATIAVGGNCNGMQAAVSLVYEYGSTLRRFGGQAVNPNWGDGLYSWGQNSVRYRSFWTHAGSSGALNLGCGHVGGSPIALPSVSLTGSLLLDGHQIGVRTPPGDPLFPATGWLELAGAGTLTLSWGAGF